MTATMTPARRYDLDQLRACAGLSYSEFAIRVGITERHAKRLAITGMSPVTADKYAIRCGWHPSEVWPGWDGDRDVTPLSDTGT